MPLHEYQCKKCTKTMTLFERQIAQNNFWSRLLSLSKKKCIHCGSRKLTRLISSFSVSSKQSTADMLNDISKMAPINFVPDSRPKGPPPGGCPYAQTQSPAPQPEKKIDRIKLT